MNIKKAVGLICVFIGFGLDVYYSSIRYRQDGIPWQIGIILGIAVTTFLVLLALKKSRWIYIVMVFQIFTTSPGQTFSLLEKETNTGMQEKTSITNEQIERDRREIASIDTDIKRDQLTLDGIPTDIEVQAKYRTTILRLKTGIDANRERKEKIEKRIQTAIINNADEKKEAVTATNIYRFYSGIANWRPQEWVMFVLHTFLSILITMMSPIGVRVIIDEADVRITKKPTSEMSINDWIEMVWYGEKTTPQKLKAPKHEVIARYCEIYKKTISVEEHIKRIGKANKIGLIGDNGDLLKTSEEAKKAMNATA